MHTYYPVSSLSFALQDTLYSADVSKTYRAEGWQNQLTTQLLQHSLDPQHQAGLQTQMMSPTYKKKGMRRHVQWNCYLQSPEL